MYMIPGKKILFAIVIDVLSIAAGRPTIMHFRAILGYYVQSPAFYCLPCAPGLGALATDWKNRPTLLPGWMS